MLKNFGHIFIPSLHRNILGGGTSTLDATGEKSTQLYQANGDITIRHIDFRTETVVQNCTLKVSLQSLDANGDPSGTMLGTNNNGYFNYSIQAADDNKHLTGQLTEDVTIAGGTFFYIVTEITPFNTSDSVKLITLSPTQYTWLLSANEYYNLAWNRAQSKVIAFALRDVAGNYIPGYGWAATSTTHSIRNNASPDEAGNVFQLPYKCRVIGAYVCGDIDVDTTVSLYGPSTVTATLNNRIRRGTNAGMFILYFPSSITLLKNTSYTLSCTNSGSATSVVLNALTVDALSRFDQFDLGQNCYARTRYQGGAWTDINTRRYCMGIIADRIDIPVYNIYGRGEIV